MVANHCKLRSYWLKTEQNTENLIFGQKPNVLFLLGMILVLVIACCATVTENFAINDEEKSKDTAAVRRQRMRTDGRLLNGLTKTWISFSSKQR